MFKEKNEKQLFLGELNEEIMLFCHAMGSILLPCVLSFCMLWFLSTFQ